MCLDAKAMKIKEYRWYLAFKKKKKKNHKSDDVTSYLKLSKGLALLLEEKKIP